MRSVVDVRLIAGGEQPTRHGPKPHDDFTLEWITNRRRNKAKAIAGAYVPRSDARHFVALGRLGTICEELIVEWLTRNNFEFSHYRSLWYRTAKPNGLGVDTFSQEVDGVVLNSSGRPKFFLEVRTSVQGMTAVKKKMAQLHRTRQIGRFAWPKVQGLLVFVRIGNYVTPNENLARTNPGWLLDRFQFRLDSLNTAFAKANIPRIVVPFNPLMRWAEEIGWEVNPSLVYLANEYAEIRHQRRMDRYEEWVSMQEAISLEANSADDSTQLTA